MDLVWCVALVGRHHRGGSTVGVFLKSLHVDEGQSR
jgi:hypothetical protein